MLDNCFWRIRFHIRPSTPRSGCRSWRPYDPTAVTLNISFAQSPTDSLFDEELSFQHLPMYGHTDYHFVSWNMSLIPIHCPRCFRKCTVALAIFISTDKSLVGASSACKHGLIFSSNQGGIVPGENLFLSRQNIARLTGFSIINLLLILYWVFITLWKITYVVSSARFDYVNLWLSLSI